MRYHTKIKEIQPDLLAFVKSRIFSLHDAQDIVQNVNLILINKKDQYDKNRNFRSWAITIAHFQIKAYLLKTKRCRVTSSLMEEKDNLEVAESILGGCPASIVEKKEKTQKLRKDMLMRKKLLSENQLKVIDLYSKGLKYKEIAETLNISISKVSVTKSRAIQRMKT